jgi:hypothetical protein
MRSLLALTFCALAIGSGSEGATISDLFCDDSARLEKQLLTIHGAQKLGRGMRGPDALLEVWIAPNSGDWTLVQSYAHGTSCIVAMGEHWEEIASKADPA